MTRKKNVKIENWNKNKNKNKINDQNKNGNRDKNRNWNRKNINKGEGKWHKNVKNMWENKIKKQEPKLSELNWTYTLK